MKAASRLISSALILAATSAAGADAPAVEVYFSPRGGCTAAIVREVGRAEREILIQAYTFTSAPIADALVAAAKRGVAVRLIIDAPSTHGRGCQAGRLADVRTDGEHRIAHSKIMIIDGRTVLTGSFNFSRQAEQANAENLLIVRDAELAAKYKANWAKHAEHSNLLQPVK